jgi:hypothetical protein
VVRSRPWRRLDIGQILSLLSTSVLCQLPLSPSDVDAAASLYGNVISVIVDNMLPAYDTECRAAKRFTHRLERSSLTASRRAVSASVDPVDFQASVSAKAAREAWLAQRRAYRLLRHWRCASFWADSQIYGSCLAVNASSLSSNLSSCIDSVSSWKCSNRLQLNANKTEVMWCTSACRLSQLPSNLLSIARTLVNPVSVVRDLGSLLILTSVHPLTFVGLCRAVSLLFVSFIISAATSPTTVSGHWSCRSFTRDLITATLSWSGHQPTSSDDYCRFSTRLLVLYSHYNTTTFPTH